MELLIMKPLPPRFAALGALILCLGFAELVFAQYTLVLKNGRRIVVQSYREEGGVIKFSSFGGEIEIKKDQVQSILKVGEAPVQANDAPLRAAPEAADAKRTGPASKEGPSQKVKTPAEQSAEERAKEEKEYQRKVQQITEEIRSVRDRYLLLARGKPGPDPTILDSEEAMKARTDDLNSRLRDVQNRDAIPSDAGGVRLSTPSPFTGVSPDIIALNPSTASPSVSPPAPSYSEREKELSDLRNQMGRLERERDQLIQEMKQKDFDTASLFLE
jgi:hypothetical protein